MNSLNKSPCNDEAPATRLARLEEYQRAAYKEYLANYLEEIQKHFGFVAIPSSSFDEVIRQARDKLDQSFEAYLASLSSRNLDNLKAVLVKLEKFKESVEYLGVQHDRVVNLIRNETARHSHGPNGAAMIQE